MHVVLSTAYAQGISSQTSAMAAGLASASQQDPLYSRACPSFTLLFPAACCCPFAQPPATNSEPVWLQLQQHCARFPPCHPFLLEGIAQTVAEQQQTEQRPGAAAGAAVCGPGGSG